MEWVETAGRTVDEAKDAALDQLGVDETDAEFIVVSEPKAGLFGRMRGEARVRARVRPTAPRPKRGRSRRSEQGGQRRRSSSQGGGRQAGSSTAVIEDDDDTDEGAELSGDGNRQVRANGSASGQEGAGSGTGPGTGARKRRRRRGGRGSGSGGNRSASAANGSAAESQGTNGDGAGGQGPKKRPARPTEAGKEEVVGETLSLQEQGEAAQEFIEGLVGHLGLEADVSVKTVDEDTVEVAVAGAELGVLIGPGGATLAALQEIARTVVQKRTGGHSERILVDVAGYRAKRAEALRKFTEKVAAEVLAESAERALEPMSAADRKVVHDAVNEIDGVVTRSEGEEPRRYIVISPAGAGADA